MLRKYILALLVWTDGFYVYLHHKKSVTASSNNFIVPKKLIYYQYNKMK